MGRERIDLSELRHRLHAAPDRSGDEAATAATVAAELEQSGPDELHTGIGGHGLIAVWRGPEPGPTVALRAELDGLPIIETTGRPYRSRRPGSHHGCGHDGHMTALIGVARRLAGARPVRGAVALVFQPAEETGEGAARVAADPRWLDLGAEWAFAVHNLPGLPLGQVRLRSGPVAAASVGVGLHLRGTSSHAAHPEQGRSPAVAMAEIVAGLDGLASRTLPAGSGHFAVSTVIHVRLGEVAFGTSPGEAVVMATLRSDSQTVLERLREQTVGLARSCADRHGIGLDVEWRDPFPVTRNHPDAAEKASRAARAARLEVAALEAPMRWSEDFGHLANPVRGALLVVGAGHDVAPLHSPGYDFPDGLLPPLVALHTGLLEALGVVAPAREAP